MIKDTRKFRFCSRIAAEKLSAGMEVNSTLWVQTSAPLLAFPLLPPEASLGGGGGGAGGPSPPPRKKKKEKKKEKKEKENEKRKKRKKKEGNYE